MTAPLRPGDPPRLGRYELVGRLGEGGMGNVFLARDPQGRQVAIKVVRPDLSHDDEFRGRFRSEVNRARQVPPFCTAEVLDAEPDHDPPFLVVEYVDGPSLAEVVRRQGPLSPAGLHSMAVGIATALTAIHGAGVIHRDLKPGNVLFALGGVKVIDFGIARAFEATSQHTRTDQVVGTVSYMAPERFDAESSHTVGPAADIFAWGAVVGYAATGRTPFAADSPPATAMRILTQPPDLTGLTGPLRGLVERALAKEPGDRPTARELLDELLTAAGQPAGAAAPAQALPTLRAASDQPAQPAGTADGPPAGAADGAVAAGAVAAGGGNGAPARGRRRWLIGLGVATAVLAVLVPGALFGRQLLAEPDSGAPAVPTGSASGSPATGTAAPTGAPSSGAATSGAAPSGAADTTRAILTGQRRALLHIAEIDRDLSMPFDGVTHVSDGTGPDALFALVPIGVDYMIKSLNPEVDHRPCLGVKVLPEESAALVAAECYPTAATLFEISPVDGTDDKGRPTYQIYNDTYGFVQWSRSRSKIYVEFLGDAPIDTTFSLVDRGPL
ncbi:serine/threonine-protein kinase [Solwaraspora sp. WMMD1047]|uniref:serine/threonine protein kinase n=1 Tax=Solwaraspora sp. WMMD1047 TaxID=3016102 RepID=UPI002417EBD0|nr:serine/threonine-protein kinase [Solwaraspora sp. WMMD1047]MDG4833454.1 serine/threonine-protein kinase [Solwaraspora sp. WMMD1047]